MTLSQDEKYMRMALNRARRGIGHVAPNPAVGCVLVKGGVILSAAHTARGGRPHAEALALEKAGADAKGASAYVSLEPCAHEGQTPPCARALIDAGVARVVFACTDPDPRVRGAGAAMLINAGVDVLAGVLEAEAAALNAGFISRVTQSRPYVTLKCAISADGKIAAEKGERTQISGEMASRYMHLLRSQNDAVMIGKATFEVDKPRLTTRIEGYEHESKTIILDKEVKEALLELSDGGVTRLLVEGGAKTHKSFLESGFFDEVHLLKSPKVLGPQGVDAADFHGGAELILKETRVLGEDMLEIYVKAH